MTSDYGSIGADRVKKFECPNDGGYQIYFFFAQL